MTNAHAPRRPTRAPSRTPPRSAPRNVRGVTLACKRCGARLVPITGKWGRDREKGTRAFKCPRLTACGYGGVVETLAPSTRAR